MSGRICRLNFCGRPQGVGTWAEIGTRGDSTTVAVCEEHWQALRSIYPLDSFPAAAVPVPSLPEPKEGP